jgi:hypothetical protein
MSELSSLCSEQNLLPGLKDLTLSLPIRAELDEWLSQTEYMASRCPIEKFNLHSSGRTASGRLTERFLSLFLHTHGHRLNTLGIQRLGVPYACLGIIKDHCPMLERLYISLDGYDPVRPGLQLRLPAKAIIGEALRVHFGPPFPRSLSFHLCKGIWGPHSPTQ